MASNASIFKATIQTADMDRHYYEDHALTLARPPSETDERMMVRLLAFVLHAHEALSFGRGVSTEEEPALWHKDLTGAIVRWIEVGQAEEKPFAGPAVVRNRSASIPTAAVALTCGGRKTWPHSCSPACSCNAPFKKDRF